jgi:type II secretory pathway pseudopilin PulG
MEPQTMQFCPNCQASVLPRKDGTCRACGQPLVQQSESSPGDDALANDSLLPVNTTATEISPNVQRKWGVVFLIIAAAVFGIFFLQGLQGFSTDPAHYRSNLIYRSPNAHLLDAFLGGLNLFALAPLVAGLVLLCSRPAKTAKRLAVRIVLSFLAVLVVAGVVAAITLPRIQAARRAAQQAMVANKLKWIGMALMEYEHSYRRLPPANANGLSWRVMLLPYLEQQKLFAQFHLNEPWDSPHNIKLLDSMPSIYRDLPDSTNKTSLLVFVGDANADFRQRCLYVGDPLNRSRGPDMVRDIRDGLAKTIAIVEAAPEKAVLWTKPEELTFDPNNPASALGNIQAETIVTLFFDGSVHKLPRDIDPHLLRQLILPSDGQPAEFSIAPSHRAGPMLISSESIEEIVYSSLRKTQSYECDLFSIYVKRVEDSANRNGHPKLVQPTIILKSQAGRPKTTITAAEAELRTERKANLLKIVCRNGEFDIEGKMRASFPDEQEFSVPIAEVGSPPH